MSTRPIPAKRKTVPKTGAVKERNDMTAKEEIIEEGRVNDESINEMDKPDEFDDDVDEMRVVMKPCMRKILQFKVPGAGQIKFDIKMEH